MKMTLAAALTVGALAFAARAGGNGLALGEKAPWPQAKETIGIPSFSAKDTEGKVVFCEIFRTW
jgi:hypothetical protein